MESDKGIGSRRSVRGDEIVRGFGFSRFRRDRRDELRGETAGRRLDD